MEIVHALRHIEAFSLQIHLHRIYQTSSVDFYIPFKGESSDFKFLKSNLGESRHKNHLHNPAFTTIHSDIGTVFSFHIKHSQSLHEITVIIIILYLIFFSPSKSWRVANTQTNCHIRGVGHRRESFGAEWNLENIFYRQVDLRNSRFVPKFNELYCRIGPMSWSLLFLQFLA